MNREAKPALYSVKYWDKPLLATIVEALVLEQPGNPDGPELISSKEHTILKARHSFMRAIYNGQEMQGIPVPYTDLPLYISYRHKTDTFDKLLSGEIPI